nr:HD domain-containing phosphohydrolase [Candidatus Burarchaeum sp.]
MDARKTAMRARRDFYREVIVEEVRLQELRYLIGTKKEIAGKEQRIEALKSQLSDKESYERIKESYGRILEGTQPASFSEQGEEIVGARLKRLRGYQLNAKYNPLSYIFFQHLRSLAFKSKCSVTERHFRGVARFAQAIYDNLSPAEKKALGATRKEVTTAALMHDEGKIEIPSSLLRATGKLTAEDITILKRHPETSMQFLEETGLPDLVIIAARQHHMSRNDANGSRSYPPKELGEELSELSQLISVADAGEAMTAGRYNQPFKSKEETVEELKRNVGQQFSPVYAGAMIRALEEDPSFLRYWHNRRNRQIKRSKSESRARKSRPEDERGSLAKLEPIYAANGESKYGADGKKLAPKNINDLD